MCRATAPIARAHVSAHLSVLALTLGLLLTAGCDAADSVDAAVEPADVLAGHELDGGASDGAAQTNRFGRKCGDVEAEMSCGGTECADLGEAARDFCAVGCCTEDDLCGTRIAIEDREPGRCTPEAQPDDRCPGLDGELGSVVGCCTPDNECGVKFLSMCTPLRELRRFGSQDVPDLIDCDGNPLPDAGGLDPDADAG